jgi:hypothetical protein
MSARELFRKLFFFSSSPDELQDLANSSFNLFLRPAMLLETIGAFS